MAATTITSKIPFADPSWHTDRSHPYYSDSHRRLQKFIRSYVDSEIAPNVEQWEKQGFVPEEVSWICVWAFVSGMNE